MNNNKILRVEIPQQCLKKMLQPNSINIEKWWTRRETKDRSRVKTNPQNCNLKLLSFGKPLCNGNALIMPRQTDFLAPTAEQRITVLVLGILSFSTYVRNRRFNTNNQLMGSGVVKPGFESRLHHIGQILNLPEPQFLKM